MGLFNLWGNRTIKLTDGDFWRSFFATGSHAGEAVSVESMLQLDAAWACVKLISEIAGSLPCMVYDAKTNKVNEAHPLYDLLHEDPNGDETVVEFHEGIVRSMLVWGNYVAEKKFNGSGKLIALNPIPWPHVRVGRTVSGDREYKILRDGKERIIPESRIFHVRNMKMPGSDVGMSSIEFARHTFGAATAAEKSSGRIYSNGIHSSGFLKSDQVLKPEQREQLAKNITSYVGSEKAGKVMVLEAGLDYQPMTISPQDAQFLESRRFSVEQICRVYGVPPVMVGHAADGLTTWGSGVEQLILQFSKSVLLPLFRRIEAAIKRDLVNPNDRKRITVKYNMEGFLRADSKSRAEFYASMVNNGIYTRNEVRALENRAPIEGADGLTAQSGFVPLEMLGQDQTERTE